MQPALDAALLYPNPQPQRRNSPYLVDILISNQPKVQTAYNVDGRTLTVTIWDTQIDLHLAGPNGGQGDHITLTPAILADIAAATV